MKSKKVRIVFSFFLLANLLFSQFGANFLHRHESHTLAFSTKNDISKAAVFATKEKCSICSWQLFHALFFEEAAQLPFLTTIHDFVITFFVFSETEFVIFCRGRAPPVA